MGDPATQIAASKGRRRTIRTTPISWVRSRRVYKGRVKAIEVWNEQNLHYEWGNEPLDPNRYVDMLCKAYQAIKAADPNMVVIARRR